MTRLFREILVNIIDENCFHKCWVAVGDGTIVGFEAIKLRAFSGTIDLI